MDFEARGDFAVTKKSTLKGIGPFVLCMDFEARGDFAVTKKSTLKGIGPFVLCVTNHSDLRKISRST
ncbi:unnamed protein product [Cyprideis torosa]|uniref:Uncharacterized protein n=1 Tax=Cyprideis torosa TaxID=163714 RepID=A0A7R8ZT63_9CRUS|nr:unnamed protein product [Cyprideis torosa]CAG0897468.1 unnamed protein product [Cyprideis torosa]